jgi:8-hydroxy-5-deazaflavin:NADPH oxidoreductase
MRKKFRLSVIGGTGSEGRGLAARLARAGHAVYIGSRDPLRALATAQEIEKIHPRSTVQGMNNIEAARASEICILTVPYTAQRATVEALRDDLQGKILIDATVPLAPPKVARVQLPANGSAVAQIQDLLGDGVRVVSAFQNVSAHALNDPDHAVECDVLVCGDDAEARGIVIDLAADIGLRGIHAGSIVNSVAAEALTSILISINMRYKILCAGIRITGLPKV